MPVVRLSRYPLSPESLPVDVLDKHQMALTGQPNTFVVPDLLDLPRLLDYLPVPTMVSRHRSLSISSWGTTAPTLTSCTIPRVEMAA